MACFAKEFDDRRGPNFGLEKIWGSPQYSFLLLSPSPVQTVEKIYGWLHFARGGWPKADSGENIINDLIDCLSAQTVKPTKF